MQPETLYILASVILVSLVSLIGAVSLLFAKKNLGEMLLFLVSFSAGALLGDVFIHLLPSSFKRYGAGTSSSLYILLGILIFFVLEKFIHWRHCHAAGGCDIHKEAKHPHGLAMMNLVGDSFHNFIDGLIIGASYLLSIPVGIATTIAVLLHEVPQEIGDFGVLLHAGLSKTKALAFNFLTALFAVVGAIIAIVLSGYIENLTDALILIAAGGFIYIAGTDLIPELHKQNTLPSSLLQLFGIVLGIGIMFLLLLVG